jgi:hypothetical protein
MGFNLLLFLRKIAIFLLISGCGVDEKKLPTSGSEFEESQFGLIGTWEGILINKAGSAQENSPTTSKAQEVSVLVKFEGKTDQEGKFLFNLKDSENALVKGNFKNFAGKSLILSILESNVSALGLTGSNTDFPYELIGNNLLLTNDRMTLKLTRANLNPNKESSPEGQSPEKSYFARWKCQDVSDRVWLLNIKDDRKFTLDITNAKSSKKFLWLDGRVEGEEEMKFLLVVERSQIEKYLGMILIGEILKDSKLLIRRRAMDENENYEKISCLRQ